MDIKSISNDELMSEVATRMLNKGAKLSIQTKAGEIRVCGSTMPGQDGVHVMIVPAGYDEEIDIVSVLETENNREDLEIRIWQDPSTEDSTHELIFTRESVLSGMPEESRIKEAV